MAGLTETWDAKDEDPDLVYTDFLNILWMHIPMSSRNSKMLTIERPRKRPMAPPTLDKMLPNVCLGKSWTIIVVLES